MGNKLDESFKRLIDSEGGFYAEEAESAKEAIWKGIQFSGRKKHSRRLLWPLVAAVLLLLLVASVFRMNYERQQSQLSLIEGVKRYQALQDSLSTYKKLSIYQAKEIQNSQVSDIDDSTHQIQIPNNSNTVLTSKVVYQTDTIYVPSEVQEHIVERVIRDTVFLYKTDPVPAQIASEESKKTKKKSSSVTFTFDRKAPKTQQFKKRLQIAKTGPEPTRPGGIIFLKNP